MNHEDFSLTELIRDDEFIEWVKSPSVETDAYWSDIIRRHPEKGKLIEMAKQYVLLIATDTGKHKPSEAQSLKMWESVKEGINGNSEVEEKADLTEVRSPFFQKWMVAAGIVLCLAFGYLLTKNTEGIKNKSEEVGANSNNDLIIRKNPSDIPLTVLLSDGSSVILYPGAEIVFEDFSTKNERKIDLKGKAFFEVSKQPDRPFMVYTKGIVTKVLGTSFEIYAPENRNQVIVSVKTGKVTVIPEDRMPDIKDIVLTENQSVLFKELEGKMVQLPEVVKMEEEYLIEAPDRPFEFDETPASDVFKALEELYHIEIVYDTNKLSNCPLTAVLGGEPLEMKLKVICHALGAEYEMKNNQVYIKSAGCQ